MTDENVETMKADAKKAVSDIGNRMAHAKADVNADVEKIKADVEKMKADFEHDGAEKKVAYAKADIKADAEKAKADVENTLAHEKAELQANRGGFKAEI
ncbi:MAG: hypothetical protein NTV25_03870 [Methanothrix sp.]|nr:hypothetical protein [Methanothrix sp.]